MNLRKYCFTVLALAVSSVAFVQTESSAKPLKIFNEFTLSVNQTAVENANTSNRMGFGIGVYRSWRDSSWFNLVSGIAYNNTNQFKKHITMGHFSGLTNATFNLHSFSVPFLMRLKFGRKTKFFVESGLFAEITPRGTCTATQNTNGTEVRITEEKAVSGANFGAIAGLGTIIPVRDYGIVAKVGYQFGVNGFDIGHETVRNVFLSASLGFRLK